MKRPLLISISIFSLAFWLWRIPFILWLPIPEFSPDTFDYFSIAKALYDKTALSYPINLPLTFPLVAYLTGVLSSKVIVIIWFQFLVKFLSGVTLIYAYYSYNKRLAILTAFALSIYMTDSWSLRYDTALVAESLYNSFLIFTVAFLIRILKSPSKSSLMLLSLSMFLVAFTRSNGFFIYFLVPIMVIYLLQAEKRTIKYISLLTPAVILHFAAFYFISNSSVLHPSEDRMLSVINRETGSLKTTGSSYFRKKFDQTKVYFSMEKFPSFYFSLLPVRYHNTYELDQIHDPDYKMYNWATPIPDDLRKFVYREYFNEPDILKNHLDMMDVSYAYSHPFFLMIHVLYKIQNLIFRNVFWYFLGLIIMLAACWRYAKSSWADRDAFLIILLSLIHFLNVLVVTFGHDRSIPRYVHVTEFLLYLAPIFFLMSILPSYNERKT